MSVPDPVSIVLNIHCSRLSGEPFCGLNLELKQGVTAKEIIALYRVDPSQMGLVTVNKRPVSEDHRLLNGDILSIYPLLDGG